MLLNLSQVNTILFINNTMTPAKNQAPAKNQGCILLLALFRKEHLSFSPIKLTKTG